MTIKLNRRSKVGLGVAALAVLAAGLPIAGTASALPTGTAAAGAAIISPATVKTSGTTFQLDVPAGASCPGDAVAGYRWYTYIMPIGSDPADHTFAPITGLPTGTGTGFKSALRNTGGALVIAQNTISIGTGLLLLPSGGTSLSFQAMAVPPGAYNVGIACTLNVAGTIENTRFWNTTTTVVASPVVAVTNPQGFIWGNPAAPPQSVLSVVAASVTPTGGVVNFTKPLAIPAVTSYTANLTGGTGTATVNAAAGTITLAGLTTGTPYSLSLTSTNGIAPDATSGSVTVTPSNATPPAPVATATSSAGKAAINWTAPASGPTPIGYSVVITGTSPVVAPQTITLGNVLTTGDVTLPVGSYSATVTATYAASEFITPVASNVVPFRSEVDTLIEQEITVTRPQLNALILTQRCGVNGALQAEAPTPRFPRDLPLLAASQDQIGTVPTPDTQANFDQYPLPANPVYPTRCGITLTNVQLITSGALRGQYFTASGALNQVTVADFRDADTGWTLTGTMANFTDGGSRSFSGNFLGWTPAAPIVSAPTATGYTQTVTAGAVVQPGDGVGTFGGTGLGSGRTLATTPTPTATTGGTGIADLNARVKLLIPTTAKAATYKGLLTFTVA